MWHEQNNYYTCKNKNKDFSTKALGSFVGQLHSDCCFCLDSFHFLLALQYFPQCLLTSTPFLHCWTSQYSGQTILLVEQNFYTLSLIIQIFCTNKVKLLTTCPACSCLKSTNFSFQVLVQILSYKPKLSCYNTNLQTNYWI